MKYLVSCGLFALALSGCTVDLLSGVDLAVGTPRDAVLARLGQPDLAVALPGGGQRLHYGVRLFGQSAARVDLDAAGRVVGVRPPATGSDFLRLSQGSWTREELLREFGPPKQTDRVTSWDGPILTYRWTGGEDQYYWVYLDRGDVVRRAHPGHDEFGPPDRN